MEIIAVQASRSEVVNGPIFPDELSAIEDFISGTLRDCTFPNIIRLKAGLRILMTTNQNAFETVCSSEVQQELSPISNLLHHPESLAPQYCQTLEGRKTIIEHIKKFTLENLNLFDERITILPKASMVEKNIEGGERLKSVIHATAIRNVITAASFTDEIEKKFKAEGLADKALEEAVRTATNAMARLHRAAIDGDMDVFKKELYTRGVDINLANPDGLTLLHVAAREAHAEMVKMLLADPNIKVNRVSSNGWSALHIAARMGHEEIVSLLLNTPGIDVNMVNSDGWTALHWSAWHGHDNIVLLLVTVPQIDVNRIDKSKSTALHWAARNGHSEVVNILVRLASPKNINTDHLYVGDMPVAELGEGPLTTSSKIISLNVNPIDIEGKTPLYYAVQFDHFAATAALLAAPGIDVNIQDMDGLTALHWAARNGSIELVNLLLGAPFLRKDLVDHNQMTAADWAERNGYPDLVPLLSPGHKKLKWLPEFIHKFLGP